MTTENRPFEEGAEEDMHLNGNRDEDKNRTLEQGTDAAARAGYAAPSPAARAVTGGAEEVLPSKAAEDDARSWGERDEDHDAWLKEQKPPHWG